MNQYKLVGCDLDGSLLNDKLKVSSENKLAMEALVNKGLHIVPITGRALSEIPEVAEISHIRYLILSNGAIIKDKQTGECIRMCMSKETSGFVLDVLRQYEAFFIIHNDGETYTNCMTDEEIVNHNVCPAVHKLVNEYSNREANFEKKAYNMDKVESFAVFFKNDTEKEACKNILNTDERLYVVDGWNHNIEIFSIDAGKDKALKILIEKLGITQNEIISIGDSGNDIGMTKFSGLGLCVSNGCEELKSIADDIICGNNEHVLNYILSNYF